MYMNVKIRKIYNIGENEQQWTKENFYSFIHLGNEQNLYHNLSTSLKYLIFFIIGIIGLLLFGNYSNNFFDGRLFWVTSSLISGMFFAKSMTKVLNSLRIYNKFKKEDDRVYKMFLEDLSILRKSINHNVILSKEMLSIETEKNVFENHLLNILYFDFDDFSDTCTDESIKQADLIIDYKYPLKIKVFSNFVIMN